MDPVFVWLMQAPFEFTSNSCHEEVPSAPSRSSSLLMLQMKKVVNCLHNRCGRGKSMGRALLIVVIVIACSATVTSNNDNNNSNNSSKSGQQLWLALFLWVGTLFLIFLLCCSAVFHVSWNKANRQTHAHTYVWIYVTVCVHIERGHATCHSTGCCTTLVDSRVMAKQRAVVVVASVLSHFGSLSTCRCQNNVAEDSMLHVVYGRAILALCLAKQCVEKK